jgi:hypothetical protein
MTGKDLTGKKSIDIQRAFLSSHEKNPAPDELKIHARK